MKELDPNIAIQVEGLSKRYYIGKEKDSSLRGTISGMFQSSNQSKDEFWALKDVSFEVKKGDVVGIIGKNGAGKSTLLKILSQITKPTEGRIAINGRIASLLEVGTGFHPELTGRENIYLNGTILGMTRKEVKAKFDEIVAFSGIEKFIDTPVKHYSSGMYVRLAFSVAAHLEPEILVIDEVLAVGDAEFQKKCLGKMQDVAGQGRTVLFVSHNMAAVKTLCNKGIFLQNGELKFKGTASETLNMYLEDSSNVQMINFEKNYHLAPGNENVRIIKAKVNPRNGEFTSMLSGIDIIVEILCSISNTNIDITLEVITQDGTIIFHNGAIITENKDSKKGIYQVQIGLPDRLLNAGVYSLNIIIGENQRHPLFVANSLITFEVARETIGSNSSNLPGLIFPELTTKIAFKEFSNE